MSPSACAAGSAGCCSAAAPAPGDVHPEGGLHRPTAISPGRIDPLDDWVAGTTGTHCLLHNTCALIGHTSYKHKIYLNHWRQKRVVFTMIQKALSQIISWGKYYPSSAGLPTFSCINFISCSTFTSAHLSFRATSTSLHIYPQRVDHNHFT